MVSILIPVYNFNVCQLIYQLHKQIINMQDAEIIIIDDKSEVNYLELNSEIAKLPKVKFLRNPVNYGRSKTRNILAKNAKNNCLIFMDGDTLPVSENYVQQYLNSFAERKILFGGIKYKDNIPTKQAEYLRWFYGKEREEISVSKRKKQGNRLFMTGNFCIDKKLFCEVKFDEKITQYGHEDTLFAFNMAERKIKIQHINNPAFHIGLETGEIFLEKTMVAIKNMHYLKKLGHNELLQTIRLWNVYQKYFFLSPFFKLLFSITKKTFIKNLRGKKPNLLFFDLYKLFGLAYYSS